MPKAGQKQDNKKNKYYWGESYEWKTDRKKGMRMLWQFSGIALAAELLCGFMPGVGIDNKAWLLLPYIGSMVFAVIVFWTVIRISRAGNPMDEITYAKSVAKLNSRSLWLAILSGINLLGELINLIWQSQFTGSTEGAIMYLLLHFLAFYCSIQLRIVMTNGLIRIETRKH